MGIACNIQKFYRMGVAQLEMDAKSRPSTSMVSEPAFVELAETNVQRGAILDVLLDVHNIAGLRWWLHAVSWNQACTLVEKGTVDFKVGSLSMVQVKILAGLPAISTDNAYSAHPQV